MNREDIIRLAREAGIADSWDLNWQDKIIERFADLVAFAEREVWERKYARLQSLMDIRETQPNKPCCLAEREACAKVCEEQMQGKSIWIEGARACSLAIRARGQV
jgi:hypothetical protein